MSETHAAEVAETDFTSAADTLDADLSAMRDGEREPPADDQTDAAPTAEKPADVAEPAEDPSKKELRSIKAALRQERQQRQALEQRLQQAAAPSQPMQMMLDGAPDPTVDPIGFMQHMQQQVAAIDAQHKADFEAEQRQKQHQAQVQSFVRTMQEFEADFKADHPDYDKAVDHFHKARSAEFEAQGLTGPQLSNAIAQDFLGLAQRCMQAGRDPAEVVYQLAQKAGFKAGAAAVAPLAIPAAPDGNVSAVDPNAQRLQQIAKGQQQARSLSAGGVSEAGAPTYEQVNKLRGAAFDAAFEKLRQAERRRA